MPKDTYIPSLLDLFCQYGYDGATLAKISATTGLGKASLYHHFPGGKTERVETVLEAIDRWLLDNLVSILEGEGDELTRFRHMCDRVSAAYAGGRSPCLLAMLLMGSARDTFQATVSQRLRTWIEAIATVLVEAGLDSTLTHQRAEDALIAIQGSLILAQGLADPLPSSAFSSNFLSSCAHRRQDEP